MSTPVQFDTRRFKAQERSGFNRIAAAYADTAHLRAELASALLAHAGLSPGQQVLDLASGPGLLARDAAAHVAPGGWVLATDIAEGMLAEGLARAAAEGCHGLAGVAADAEHLCLPDARFDRVLAGLALFMFPHPGLALGEARRVLRRGGRLVLSVWGPRDQVALIARAQDAIAATLPPPKVQRPSVFRFGDEAVLTAALHETGFSDVRIEPCRFACHFDTPEDYWQAFLSLAGGVSEALAGLPGERQQALVAAVAEALESHREGTGYRVDALCLIASAQA